MELELLRDTIEAAGVIGAGGAGFPTHRKPVSYTHLTLPTNSLV